MANLLFRLFLPSYRRNRLCHNGFLRLSFRRKPESSQIIIKIRPVWVPFLDQFQFPLSFPFLDSFFSRNRSFHSLINFIPNQLVYPIAFAKFLYETILCSRIRLIKFEVTHVYNVPLRRLAKMYTRGCLSIKNSWTPASAGVTAT